MGTWKWQFVDPIWRWSIGLANNNYVEIVGWKHFIWRFWWRRW